MDRILKNNEPTAARCATGTRDAVGFFVFPLAARAGQGHTSDCLIVGQLLIPSLVIWGASRPRLSSAAPALLLDLSKDVARTMLAAMEREGLTHHMDDSRWYTAV